MVVGLLRLTLHVPEARSLKDRRMAVRRAVERVRARFNVAIAEVGDQTRWQIATLAITTVSNDRGVVNEVLDRVTSTVASAGSALVLRRELEVLSYSDDEPIGDDKAFLEVLDAQERRATETATPKDDDDDAEPR